MTLIQTRHLKLFRNLQCGLQKPGGSIAEKGCVTDSANVAIEVSTYISVQPAFSQEASFSLAARVFACAIIISMTDAS